jgi:hypothetical protein
MMLPGEIADKKQGRVTPCELAENVEINLHPSPMRITLPGARRMDGKPIRRTREPVRTPHHRSHIVPDAESMAVRARR